MSVTLDQLIDPGFSSVITRAFHQMDLAEQAIDAAKARHPRQTDAVHQAFRILQPTAPLANKGDELILAHCAELLDRVAAGLELSPPTKAEMLAFLVDLTLITPAGPEIEYWHATLFLELYASGRLTVTDPDLTDQVQENVKASAYRTSKDELDAFYAKLQRELSCERPTS